LELTGRLSVESALIAMMTGSAVIAVWFVSQLELTLNRPIREIARNWRLLAVDGLSPMFGSILMLVSLRINRLILAVVAGASSVGILAVALMIPETLRMLPKAFGQVAADRGRHSINSAAEIRQLSKRFLIVYSILLVTMGLTGMAVLQSVFGQGFRSAAQFIPVAVVAEMFLATHLFSQALLEGFGRFNVIGRAQVIGGSVTVVLNIVLIHFWNIWGATVACLLGYGTLSVVSMVLSREELRRLGK